MVLALRKAFLLVVMVLALLAGTLGWAMRTLPAAPVHHSSGMHSTHTLAMVCPPPPYIC